MTDMDELEDKAPSLALLKGQLSRPEVPDGYFSGLPDAVLGRARAQQTGSPPAQPKKIRQLWARLAVAATVALLLAAGGYWWTQLNRATTDGTLADLEELSTAEISDYIAANIDDFDGLILETSTAEDLPGEGWLQEMLPEDIPDVYLEELLEETDWMDL